MPGHLHPAEVAGHGLVGGDHELLDDAVRHVALGAHDGRDAPLQIEEDLLLRQVEVDAPAARPLGPDRQRQVARLLQHRGEAGDLGQRRRVAPLERPGHRRVGQPRVGVDHGLEKIVVEELALARELEHRREGQAVDPGVEAADAVREPLGEHRQHPAGEVDAGAARESLPVHRPPLGDVVRDVRDVHAQQPGPLGRQFERDGVVEIPGGLAVDGHGEHPAQVGTPGALGGAHLRGDGLGVEQHAPREAVREVELPDDHLLGDTRGALVPEHLDDGRLRGAAGRRPRGDLGDDHLPGLRFADAAVRDEDVLRQARVGGCQVGVLPGALDPPDDARARAHQHAHDAALGAAPAGDLLLDAHEDAVRVHRAAQFARLDEHVPRRFLVEHHEAVAVGVHLEAPGREVHLGAHAEALAAGADEVARLAEAAQQRLEVAFAARGHLEQVLDVAQAHGVRALRAQEEEHLVAQRVGFVVACPRGYHLAAQNVRRARPACAGRCQGG